MDDIDEIDALAKLPTPRFLWGFAIAATPSGGVAHDEFEYLTHTHAPRFICRVVELEDAPADPQDDPIDGRVLHFENPRRLFYLNDLGLALTNFTLLDKISSPARLRKICDEAAADWLIRRDVLDREPEDDPA